MKIEKFRGSKVHGYLNFDIEFNDELTFLTGVNGAGKTTILNSIEALLVPRLDYLTLFEFDSLELIISNFSDSVALCAKGGEGITTVTCSKFPNEEFVIYEKIINEFLTIDFDSSSDRNGIEKKLQNYVIDRMGDNVVFKYISELPDPVVLGFDRIVFTPDQNASGEISGYSGEKLMQFRSKNMIGTNSQDKFTAALKLAHDARLDCKKKMNVLDHVLRRDLFSTFLEMQSEEKSHSDANLLDNSQSGQLNEIDEMLDFIIENFKNFSDDLRTELQPIFNYITKQKSNLDYIKRSNNTQNAMENGKEIVADIKKENIKKIYSRIKFYNKEYDIVFLNVFKFLLNTNRIFKECKKHVLYNENDLLEFILTDEYYEDGRNRPLSVLSSGEKNVIILFSYLYFKLETSPTEIYLIDEPELSLHLTWQNIIVDSFVDDSNESQLILATHSPSIVRSRLKNCKEVFPAY